MHAGALAGPVLGLVDLRRLGMREDPGAGRPFDHHGDAGVLGRGERTRHFTDTQQRVSQRAVVDEKLRQGAEALLDRLLLLLH